MRYLVGFAYVLALGLGLLPVGGCAHDGGTSGSGGTAGSGGDGGMDGGGGHAGEGCFGGAVPICPPLRSTCMNGGIAAVDPCCELPAPPAQENACDGTESLENPTQCTATGNAVRHRLTLLQLAEDCNRGFDLDSCNGFTCIRGEDLGEDLSEGVDGVDNALATLVSPRSGDGDGQKSGLNQALADAICGLSGRTCTTPIPALNIELSIDANADENCAHVVVLANGSEVGRVIVNLSDPTVGGTKCASGTLGAFLLTLGDDEIALSNALMRVTISDAGLSDGLLGATADSDGAAVLGELSYPGLGAVIQMFLDINNDLALCDAPCEALSGTYEIGGVAEVARGAPRPEPDRTMCDVGSIEVQP